MSVSYLPAVAAFAGSAIGGFAVLVSSWVTQNRVNNADWVARFTGRRQDLYKQFIEETTKLYAQALSVRAMDPEAPDDHFRLVETSQVRAR
jgi:hypothetical protein